MILTWCASRAVAHTGSVPLRGLPDWSALPDLAPGAWIVWDLFPSVVLGCLGWIALYAWLAGPGRRRWGLSDAGPTRGEQARFVAGIAVVFVALQGPLHELSDRYLFSAHMLQHLLITLVFPQLFLTGIPGWMWRPLVGRPGLARFGRALTRPVVAVSVSTVTLYAWHVPALYDLALFDHGWHIVEHLTFMAGAVVMWWPVHGRAPEVPRLSLGYRLVYLVALTIPMKALGAWITVSDELLYEFYGGQPRVFGLDPLGDQRLGGLLMWVPAGLALWVSMGLAFFRGFAEDRAVTREAA